jgi:hypothetical protein
VQPGRSDEPRDVRYVVLSDPRQPALLARVRWPDVFEAISPARPHWQSDPGLFDLPYDPGSTLVTRDRAAAIAAEWGAELPDDDTDRRPTPSLMRRMPANWSDLSRAEQHAWSIEPASLRGVATTGATGWRRRRAATRLAPVPDGPREILAIVDAAADPDPEVVIDLTDARRDRLVEVEGA